MEGGRHIDGAMQDVSPLFAPQDVGRPDGIGGGRDGDAVMRWCCFFGLCANSVEAVNDAAKMLLKRSSESLCWRSLHLCHCVTAAAI